MEQIISINISMEDLKTLVKDLISEYMVDYSKANPSSKSDLFTHAQVFEKFYIKPERLREWKERGLINEYPTGKIVKFKISELFNAIETLAAQLNLEKEKEVSNG
jgi:hypothetical protein